MAYHRTRSDKQKAQQYRQSQTNTYTYPGLGADTKTIGAAMPATTEIVQGHTSKSAQIKPLVRTEPALIKKDLVKTMFVSLLLVSLLLGIYVWTRYNGLHLPFLS